MLAAVVLLGALNQIVAAPGPERPPVRMYHHLRLNSSIFPPEAIRQRILQQVDPPSGKDESALASQVTNMHRPPCAFDISPKLIFIYLSEESYLVRK